MPDIVSFLEKLKEPVLSGLEHFDAPDCFDVGVNAEPEYRAVDGLDFKEDSGASLWILFKLIISHSEPPLVAVVLYLVKLLSHHFRAEASTTQELASLISIASKRVFIAMLLSDLVLFVIFIVTIVFPRALASLALGCLGSTIQILDNGLVDVLLLPIDAFANSMSESDVALDPRLRVLQLDLLGLFVYFSSVRQVDDDLDVAVDPALAVALDFYAELLLAVLVEGVGWGPSGSV